MSATYALVHRQMLEGEAVKLRECRICGQEIALVVIDGTKPMLRSCECRKPEQSRLVDLAWDQVQKLVEQQA